MFGVYLHLGERFHFWPIVTAQCALTIWIIGLTLRVFGLGQRPLRVLAIVTVLSVTTALPWLTSVLLTDIFTGLSLLALYLLVFRPTELKRWERITLFAVIAFSSASHSATLAMLLAIVCAAALATVFVSTVASDAQQLIYAAAAIGLGAAMLLTTNFALSGRFVWTPGGYGIAFGRMLQDGIVTRYLKNHCPGAGLKLCPYGNELPSTQALRADAVGCGAGGWPRNDRDAPDRHVSPAGRD
jgi:hypothetical protein